MLYSFIVVIIVILGIVAFMTVDSSETPKVTALETTKATKAMNEIAQVISTVKLQKTVTTNNDYTGLTNIDDSMGYKDLALTQTQNGSMQVYVTKSGVNYFLLNQTGTGADMISSALTTKVTNAGTDLKFYALTNLKAFVAAYSTAAAPSYFTVEVFSSFEQTTAAERIALASACNKFKTDTTTVVSNAGTGYCKIMPIY